MSAPETLEEGLQRDYMPRRRRQEDVVSNLRLAQSRASESKSFAQPVRPGFYWCRGHEVHVTPAGEVDFCDCPSWRFRGLCRHGERVRQRPEVRAMRLGLGGLR